MGKTTIIKKTIIKILFIFLLSTHLMHHLMAAEDWSFSVKAITGSTDLYWPGICSPVLADLDNDGSR